VSLSLFTPQRRIGRIEVLLHSFITSVIDGGFWSTSRPGRSISRKVPGTDRTIGWFVPRAGVETLEKSSAPCRVRTSDPLYHSLVAVLTHSQFSTWRLRSLLGCSHIVLSCFNTSTSLTTWNVILSSYRELRCSGLWGSEYW